MVRFPETVQTEWENLARQGEARISLGKRLERGVAIERKVEALRVLHEAKIVFQQELDAAGTPELKIMTGDEYMNSPAALAPPVDLIEGVVKENGLCIVMGPSSSGKTSQALQMVHSLYSGVDWLGQRVVQLSGGFGILSYDQDASITFNWLGASGFDMKRVSLVDAFKAGNPMGVPALRAQIAEAWRAMNVEVVILDTFSASFFAQDQNDAAATMAHYRDMKLFALGEVGAKVLIVLVHTSPGNASKARGSTVHHDVADSIVMVEGTKSDPRKISMVKYRAGIGQTQMSPVIVTVPDAVTHLVDLDVGAMTLAGLPLPKTVTAMFPTAPQPTQTPDTTTDEEDVL